MTVFKTYGAKNKYIKNFAENSYVSEHQNNIAKNFALLKQPIRCDKVVSGSVAEWLKAHDSKSCNGLRRSGVRIPSLPPSLDSKETRSVSSR